jgi:hypothetical protein
MVTSQVMSIGDEPRLAGEREAPHGGADEEKPR